MLSHKVQLWEREFRAAARADNYALYSDHMRRLGLPDKPRLMLEGTIRVVQATIAYAVVDGQPFDGFLRMQKYDPCQAPDARYAFTFDLFGKAFARVLVDAKMQTLDLADLFNHPWDDYEVAGYQRIWITHPDWTRLTAEETNHLEEDVTNDLRFDYSEDELVLWFEDSPDDSYLIACVADVPGLEGHAIDSTDP